MDQAYLLSLLDVLSSDSYQSDTGNNADVVFTLENSVLLDVRCGYSQAPAAGATLTIAVDGVVKIKIPITQDGPVPLLLPRPAIEAPSATITVTLSASGGAGVIGYLSIASVSLGTLIAFVQQEADTAAAPELIMNLPAPPTVGNSLITCITLDGALNAITSVVGGSGNAFTLARVQGSDEVISAIWYLHNAEVADQQITIDVSDGSSIAANVSEWSGLADAAPEVSGANTNTSAVVASNPVTPLSANSLVIAGAGWSGAIYDSGPTNGFTRLTEISQALTSIESAYQIESDSAAYSTGWDLTTLAVWSAVIVSFKGVA